MNACKQHRRQLALLSAQALNEREKEAALAHVDGCADCRAYWEQLQAVSGLLRGDAERRIEVTPGPVFVRPERESRGSAWLTLPRAVALAAGMFVICAAPLVLRKSERPPEIVPVARQARQISVPTIADSRRLVDKDLEALADTGHEFHNPDFVFTVGSRYEGP